MANHLDLEEQEQLDQLKHFWNTWGTPITAVLLVVMGGLAAWNGYQYWQNRQASQAAALLDAVEVAVQARDQARVELAVGDLKSKYAGTPQADMGAFASAKAMQDSGNLDAAKSALTWVAEHSSDAGYKAIAKLRLSAILLDQKDYASALQQLQGNFLQPMIQKQAVDVPPAVLLFAVVAAGVLFGFLGVLLAAPLTVVVYVLVQRIYVKTLLGKDIKIAGAD